MIKLKTIRTHRISKGMAVLLSFLILEPARMIAITSGPTQVEFQRFGNMGSSGMVDPFTGNVNYSIPIADVEGYPLTLSYTGDISPEANASWVGLGWTLQAGAITRALRGIPDDFDGDEITSEIYEKPHEAFSVNFNPHLSENSTKSSTENMELFGVKMRFGFNFDFTLSYDNYSGIGLGYNLSPFVKNLTIGDSSGPLSQADSIMSRNDLTALAKKAKLKSVLKGKDSMQALQNKEASFGLSLNYNSYSGLSVSETGQARSLGKSPLLSLLQTDKMYSSREGLYSAGFSSGSGKLSNIIRDNTYQDPYLVRKTVFPYDLNRVNTSVMGIFTFSKRKVVPNSRAITVMVSYNRSNYSRNGQSVSKKAYGFFNLDKMGDVNSLHDYSENPQVIDERQKSSAVLNMSSYHQDYFNICANGIGGSLKANLNSLTVIGPKQVSVTPSTSVKLKVELGKGTSGYEIGADIGLSLSEEKQERWHSSASNSILSHLGLKSTLTNTDYLRYNFRNEFEFIENPYSFYNSQRNTELMSVPVTMGFGKLLPARAINSFDSYDGSTSVNAGIYKDKREASQQVVSKLTAKEASTYGLIKKIENFEWQSDGQPTLEMDIYGKHRLSKSEITRNSGNRKDHHLSEFDVIQPDGTRYSFGIPVYNNVEDEYNFNTNSSRAKDFLKRTVEFNSNDYTINSNNGISEFYSIKHMAPYAHSFLLSAYMSPDYVDVTGDGPSPDDLGTYVKFNYGMPNSNDYKWKSPYNTNLADYNIGVRADSDDDMGSLSYGEKELWYMHSIETKDKIMFFEIAKRYDGLGVNSVSGGVGSSVRQYYLSKIVIFSRADFEKNGYAAAKPLKIVDFGYSYDMCNGVPNWNKPVGSPNYDHPLKELNPSKYNSYWDAKHGKLTLNRVKIYYGDLNSKITTNYYFEYNGYNPDYVYKSINRWGAYTPVNLLSGTDASSNPQTMALADYPYVPQDRKNDVDSWSRAWMMTDVTLPSGGTIHFDYESDDYAYVQDKPAMQMLRIYGFNDDNAAAVSQGLVRLQDNATNPLDFVYFKKPKGMGTFHASDFLLKNTETQLLYFNACMRLGKADDGLTYNYVPGFCEIESSGDRIIGTDSLFYIKLKHFHIRKKSKIDLFKHRIIHPFVKMALQYGLSETQYLLYPGSNLRKDSRFSENQKTSKKMAKVAVAIFGIFGELQKMFTEESNYFINKNVCNHISTERSYMRFSVPTMKKLGGGHRVRKVSITDRWDRFTGNVENSATYSTIYDYSMPSADSSNLISSGVATYEPIAGGDENPFKMPIDVENMIKFNTKSKPGHMTISYDLEPLGEEFFPGPSVGYRKVTMTNVVTNANVKRHKTGRTELEFYSAYDFPTISEKTDLQYLNPRFANPLTAGTTIGKKGGRSEDKMKSESKKKAGFDLGVSVKFSRAGASQGFLVELNDMHGRPKAEWVFGEESTSFISGTEYFYKTNASGGLVNDIIVLRPDGTFAQAKAGERVETIVYASRYVKKELQLNAQIDVNIIQPPPTIVVPSVFPQLVLEKMNNRLITVTKLVHRSGIVDSIVVHDKGATTSTHNIAWDALTGQVLLSSSKNEYGDKVFQLAKPASWMYPGMSGAYINTDAEVNLSDADVDGFPEVPGFIFPGDELIEVSGSNKYWVLDTAAGEAGIIDINGNPQVPTGVLLRVQRSGHRNILNQTAEQITLQGDPLDQGDNTFDGPYLKVISASGFVYNDINQLLYKDHICFTAVCGDSSQFSEELVGRDSLTDLGTLLSHYTSYSSSYGYSPIDTNTSVYLIPYKNNYNASITFANCSYGEGVGEVPQELCSGLTYKNPGDLINPFVWGIRGVWRHFGEYTYYEKKDARQQRTQPVTGNDLNTTQGRNSGFIQTFREFWFWDGNNWHPRIQQTNENPWTWKDSTTYVDNYGNHLESVDALSMHNATLYGFNRKFPIATAQNARYSEIMYEGFEDIGVDAYFDVLCSKSEPNAPDFPSYGSAWAADICDYVRHWPVGKALLGTQNRVSNKFSHTGYHALKLHHGITDVGLNDTLSDYHPTQLFGRFKLDSRDFAPKFYPKKDKAYIVSMWVMESWNNQFSFVMKDALGNTISLAQEEKPIVINGWKKLTFRFVPVSNSPLLFRFINRAPIIDNRVFCYLDDIRVFPADAEMESFVYDNRDYKIMATLDRNNFATFFQYDAEGKLIRQKTETEKGIMTIKEQRSSLRKQ